MAKKDKTQKSLEELTDVFSDIVNVLLFDGKRIIHEDDLREASPYSNYTAGGKVRDQERDVVKYWQGSKLRLATIGIENQTECDKNMAVRIINYDGASYRKQLADDKNADCYPVVSLVLYYGYKHNWDKAKNLVGCLNIPYVLKGYVSDYKMNLFEIAYLTDEQVNMFKSDFRLVADYFVQMRKTGIYTPPTDEIVHVQEVLSLMSALTNDNRFIVSYEEVKKETRVNMCEVLDVVEARGVSKGREEGRKEGRDDVLISLVNDGLLDVKEAAKRAGKTVKAFKKAMKDSKANA